MSDSGPADSVRLDKLTRLCCNFLRVAVLSLLLAAGAPAAIVVSGPRIVSLAPHITEMVFAAGAGQQLVGVVAYSDYPPAARDIPRVGDAFRLDYESMALLQPDVVLAWASGNPREMTDRLVDLGYTLVRLEPRRLDDIPGQLESIGALAGTAAEAAIAADQFRSALAALRANAADLSPLRVFLQFAADPYFTVNGQHIASEVLALCGGQNIFADMPLLAPTVGLEAIIRGNPEVILATTAADSDGSFTGWQNWQAVAAVQAGTLYTVDPDLVSRAGPRLIDGARQICSRLELARQKLQAAP